MKPSRVGGAVETLRIAVVAADAGIPVVLSTFFETGIGLAAALHVAAALRGDDVAHGIATARPPRLRPPRRRPAAADGAIDLPDSPGLGVEADADLLAEFRDTSGVAL